MFSIDDKFLEEIGLGSLPESEKPKMRAHVYETLEMRVGMKLARGMTENQLGEFEGLIGGDVARASAYLSSLNPNWQQDQNYQRSLEAETKRAEAQGRLAKLDAVTTEFASLKWLEANFPGYKQVVTDELNNLKSEITRSAPQILASTQGDSRTEV